MQKTPFGGARGGRPTAGDSTGSPPRRWTAPGIPSILPKSVRPTADRSLSRAGRGKQRQSPAEARVTMKTQCYFALGLLAATAALATADSDRPTDVAIAVEKGHIDFHCGP